MCQAHAATSACTVRVTRLVTPHAAASDHPIERGPSLWQETLGPTREVQPGEPPVGRHLRISLKNPSSAGPGSDWLMRVPPCRSANNAPPSVRCAASPEADESVVAANSPAVLEAQKSGTSGPAAPGDPWQLPIGASFWGEVCTALNCGNRRGSAGWKSTKWCLSVVAGSRPIQACGPVGAEPVKVCWGSDSQL